MVKTSLTSLDFAPNFSETSLNFGFVELMGHDLGLEANLETRHLALVQTPFVRHIFLRIIKRDTPWFRPLLRFQEARAGLGPDVAAPHR